jgi:hypothetical protein
MRDLQSGLMELFISPSLLDRFAEDPVSACGALSCSDEAREFLARIPAGGLMLFREVVEGTRQEQFQNTFPRLAKCIGSDWSDLVTRFQRTVRIESVRKDQDLFLFVEWVRSQFPKDVCALERLAMDVAIWQVRPGLPQVVRTVFDLDRPNLLEAPCELLVFRYPEQPDLQIAEVDALTAEIVRAHGIGERHWSDEELELLQALREENIL